MQFCTCIVLAGVILYIVLPATSQSFCSDNAQCNNGICENTANSGASIMECTCNSGYIGNYCNATFNIEVNVSNSIPLKGDTVGFSSTVSAPSDASLDVIFPNGENSSLSTTDGEVYKIDSVTFSDVGEYLFTATTIYDGTHSVSELVVISYVLTVSITHVESNVFFREGQEGANISVNVHTDGNVTFLNVSIAKDGEDLGDLSFTEEGQTREYTYVFSKAISTENGGTYEITATENYSGIIKTAMATSVITVEVPPSAPTINGSSSEVTVIRGTELILMCQPTDGTPVPSVAWSHGGAAVSSSSSTGVFQNDDGLLVFGTSTPFNTNGTYTCTAKSQFQSNDEQNTAETSITVFIEGSPTLSSQVPDTIMMKESVEFACTFDAYPPSSVSWSWNGKEISSDEMFLLEEKYDLGRYYRKTYELRIEHSALCLGDGTLTCSALNTLNQDNPEEANFLVNNEKFRLYRNSYIVFFDGTKSFDQASDYCRQLNGSLVEILIEADQNVISGFADEFGITEFYMGLQYVNSGWRWLGIDRSPQYVNWNGGEGEDGCGINKKTTSGWVWSAVPCAENKAFSCEIEASRFPSNLVVNGQKCNGKQANVLWTPGGYFNQSIEITPSNDIPTEDLSPDASSKDYTDLSYQTNYNIKISTGIGVCSLFPYTEKGFSTAYQKAAEPTVTVDADTCNVSWTYPEERKSEVDNFQVTITESVNVGSGETLPVFDSNVTVYSHQINTNPNSVYNIEIRTLSCIGNSDIVIKTCVTDIAKVEPPNNALGVTTGSETNTANGISISLNKVSERNGLIECLYVVARWRRSVESFSTFDIDKTLFNAIKQNNDPSKEGEDYFAFAVQNKNHNLTIGIGEDITNCPSSREKRSTIASTVVSAYNQPLESDASYQFYIITAVKDGSNLLISNGAWSDTVLVNKPAEPVNIVAIVLPIVIVILLVLIVILFLLLRKSRRKARENRQPPNEVSQTRNAHVNQAFAENIYENPSKDTSIAVENLRSTYQSKHADEDRLFREEYRALATEVSELIIHFNYAMAAEVRDKNRFSNIHPANESRVVLRREGNDIYSDYINASYLDGYRHPRKFIAAQGPLTNTMGDFWYMVWEQESTVIVMLTRVDEGGRRKCEKYWPDDHEQCTFDNLMLKTLSTVVYGPIIKRTFQLSNPNQSVRKTIVEQFHYVTWPDHGVPVSTSALFNLGRMVTESQANNPSPIIVHCSAGVGRTGTFIALDCLSHQMERESKVDVYGVILNMRRKRKEMVQTLDQYVLLHKLMVEKHLFGTTDMQTSEFVNAHSGSYESVDVEDGFYNLAIVPPLNTNAQVPYEAQANIRDKDVVPYQQSKVIIRMRPSEEKSRFFNASYVQTYSASEAFIACQGPMESEIEDFWRIVLDHNVTAIVMLSKLQENGEEHSSHYWPNDCETPSVFGDITISLQSETKANGLTERWMSVSEKVLHLRRSLSVMQLQYNEWPHDSIPPDASDLLDMIARSQASRKTGQGKSPVLVHCRNGSGRTGTFCTIVNLVERLKNEDRIDIFRTVKDLRDMRPLMVKSLEQYRFCVQAIKEYLDSFQLYANFK